MVLYRRTASEKRQIWTIIFGLPKKTFPVDLFPGYLLKLYEKKAGVEREITNIFWRNIYWSLYLESNSRNNHVANVFPLHILESEESALVVVPHCHRGMREVKCHPTDTVHFLLLLQLQREMLFKLPESWKLHDNGLFSISGKVFWVRIIKPWKPPKWVPLIYFGTGVRLETGDRLRQDQGSLLKLIFQLVNHVQQSQLTKYVY